ncbi:MAG: SRPBCC family protein [Bacteroidales bacterium]|nr:SRPBCC family protein [Bacteroidales bacterium]
MNITSDIVSINVTNEQVFSLVNDCTHLEHQIPGVQDWVADAKQCSFTVNGVGRIEMKIKEEIPYSKVVYSITSAMASQSVDLLFLIDNQDEMSTLTIQTEVDLPFMVSQMVKKPLQKFVNTLAAQIKTTAENR